MKKHIRIIALATIVAAAATSPFLTGSPLKLDRALREKLGGSGTVRVIVRAHSGATDAVRAVAGG